MVHDLHLFLIDEYKQGHTVVLLIDEAQNLPIETLKNLHMLSNLETNKDKLIQIVLVGQPEFGEKLKLKELSSSISVLSCVPILRHFPLEKAWHIFSIDY